MTPKQLTQAAASRCADLANAEGALMSPQFFMDGHRRYSERAFRRYVETEDATKREVLALLGQMPGGHPKRAEAIAILRANLLPDPKPTLLEEFMAEYAGLKGTDTFIVGASAALDWITKRQENEG